MNMNEYGFMDIKTTYIAHLIFDINLFLSNIIVNNYYSTYNSSNLIIEKKSEKQTALIITERYIVYFKKLIALQNYTADI